MAQKYLCKNSKFDYFMSNFVFLCQNSTILWHENIYVKIGIIRYYYSIIIM
jgi:hypothetical protein